MSFEVIPAIDLRGGRVVRLRQGDYGHETRYADEPLALARRYADAGARWLHLVDLDAARSGSFTQLALVDAIRRETGLSVQAGGGVRGEADVDALLDAGAQRVVVGTLAVREPARVRGWLARWGGDALCLAFDARQDAAGAWQLAVDGWTREAGSTLDGALAAYEGSGFRHVLCTDIARDGMLGGASVGLYAELVRRWPALRVIASGGVGNAEDLVALRAAGVPAVVLGKALLDGVLSPREALAC